MIEEKKIFVQIRWGRQVSLKAYMAFALLFLGLIAFNYVNLIEWIINQSLLMQLFIFAICMFIGYIFFLIITSTLSLNHYGDTALEITVDEVILGKSLDAKIYLGKHFNVKDEVEVELTNGDKIYKERPLFLLGNLCIL